MMYLTHGLPGNEALIWNIILFKTIIQNSRLGTRCEIALKWKLQNFINEKSTLVQVMSPSDTSPVKVRRLGWINIIFETFILVF